MIFTFDEKRNIMPKLLQLVAKSQPILRQTITEVQDFDDPTLHEIIKNMCYSILPQQLRDATDHDSAAGMAANQWGINRRIFLFTPDGSAEGNRLEVMLNPSYIPHLHPGETSPLMTEAYEGCFSIPLTTAWVKRYAAIIATYQTPHGEKITRIIEGWEARVFQHETDHLDGKLFDGTLDHYPGPPCCDRHFFKDRAEMMDFWETVVRPSRKNSSE